MKDCLNGGSDCQIRDHGDRCLYLLYTTGGPLTHRNQRGFELDSDRRTRQRGCLPFMAELFHSIKLIADQGVIPQPPYLTPLTMKPFGGLILGTKVGGGRYTVTESGQGSMFSPGKGRRGTAAIVGFDAQSSLEYGGPETVTDAQPTEVIAGRDSKTKFGPCLVTFYNEL